VGVSEKSDLGTCLVTGAAGYLGRNLAEALVARGHRVKVLDVVTPKVEGAEILTGDVRDAELVAAACEGVDTVFHAASVIDTLTLARRARRERIETINVGGTENVLAACRAHGVKRLVYTSSINVVVDRVYEGGDESAPYASKEPLDLYTRTKAEAEKLVLDADSDALHTAAIRPGGIYGPGEPQHFPRAVREVLRGRFVSIVGDGNAKADNVYIDNLVEAHLLCAESLLDAGSPARGKGYFISDGEPVNYFEFFRPVVEGLGKRFPTMHVPGFVLRMLAWVLERVHYVGGPYPMFTRMEVKKLLESHWFVLDGAKRDLGWEPKVSTAEGYRRSMPWIEALAERTPYVARPHWAWWVAVWGGLGLLFALTFSSAAYGAWIEHLPMFPLQVLQIISAVAIALHVGEGLYAYLLAKRIGHGEVATGWGIQTLLLGFPSLRLLLAKRSEPATSPAE